MKRRRGPLIAMVIVLVAAGATTWGGFSIYSDQHSGTKGRAKVTSCTGRNGKYGSGVHCTGSWIVGGSLVTGNGRVAIGPIEGADKDDVGKEIDVRLHGTDHATKPSIATPIVLWLLGAPITLLCLFGIFRWWRGPRLA